MAVSEGAKVLGSTTFNRGTSANRGTGESQAASLGKETYNEKSFRALAGETTTIAIAIPENRRPWTPEEEMPND